MRLTSITIYCLSNVRAPWVLVFEPHPWGHGALRVSEAKAVRIYERVPTRMEREFTAGSARHLCLTFTTLEGLLDYEGGQHEHADQVREAVEFRRREVDAVLAEVERKRAAKRAEERRRALPTVSAAPAEDDDGMDSEGHAG